MAAARVIGERYETGDGVSPDIAKAIGWYQQAAFRPPVMTTVYMPGYGKTPGATIPITVGPARPGDPVAMAHLGRLYLSGRGVPVDAARGDRLLACAAGQGVALGAGMTLIGKHYVSNGEIPDHG